MTTLVGFPSPAELAARTPADRDRAIDVIRITALIGVVLGHTVMAISIVRNHVLIWDNLLTTSAVFQALTWIFQIMPLFFFAGAAACVSSWRPGTNWGGWLMKRCTRLFRPVFYYLAFWAVALTALYPLVSRHVYHPVAGVSIQLLWFLGAYVLVLAAMPAMSRIATTGRLAAGVATVYGAIAAVDVVRLNWPAASALGYLNLAVWLIPAMFGVAYRRQLLTARAALGSALALLAVDVALVRWGPYELSMVGTGDHRLSNTSPPSPSNFSMRASSSRTRTVAASWWSRITLARVNALETRNRTVIRRNSRCQGSSGRKNIPPSAARKLTPKATAA
jgi:Acyltransferase family